MCRCARRPKGGDCADERPLALLHAGVDLLADEGENAHRAVEDGAEGNRAHWWLQPAEERCGLKAAEECERAHCGNQERVEGGAAEACGSPAVEKEANDPCRASDRQGISVERGEDPCHG